jgi:Flp pilus assembly protein TadG
MRDLIFRPAIACLARRLTGLRDDGGAIAVLVAVLIGAGVLFGMGALVIDVGQLYENRAELQNGADAAALAVARSCAQGTCDPSKAATYANDNASRLTGGRANVTFVCGATGVNGAVPVGTGLCPVTAKKNACPPNPAAGANYVDVETSTLLPNGSTVLPPVLGGTLVSGYSGRTVYACAQAEWGGPATSATVGFTISACDWDGATGVGTSFGPQPPYPTNSGPNPSYAPYDHLIYLKGGPTGGCTSEPPAQNDSPGNFGWTDDAALNCTTFVSKGTYSGSTGNSVDQYCKTALPTWQQNRTVLYVPVYSSIANPGANAVYTLKGFAAFVITGYKLPSMSATDWVTGSVPNCGGGNTCISGFFTQALVDTTGSFGGVNLGATMMKLTG